VPTTIVVTLSLDTHVSLQLRILPPCTISDPDLS